MNTRISTEHRVHGIAVNLASLRRLLFRAYYLSNEAYTHVTADDYHGAVGALTGLDIVLNDAKAFYRAALALYCSPSISSEGLSSRTSRRRPS